MISNLPGVRITLIVDCERLVIEGKLTATLSRTGVWVVVTLLSTTLPAQEVFVEALQKWANQPHQQWGGLLRRMAVCRAVDELRRKKPLDPLPEAVFDVGAVDPSEAAVAQELEERLRQALAKLPQREAEVFCLHYFERLAQPDIAELLGIAHGAVATALCKGRAKLAIQLGEVS